MLQTRRSVLLDDSVPIVLIVRVHFQEQLNEERRRRQESDARAEEAELSVERNVRGRLFQRQQAQSFRLSE